MNRKSLLFVSAVSGLVMSATACGVAANSEPVKCQGINECAGQGECAGADGENDCQGNNSCQGQGWITVDNEAACTDQGGTILDA